MGDIERSEKKARLERIKEAIRDVADRPRSVALDELKRIVDQLQMAGYSARYRRGTKHWVFYVGGEIITVSDHNPGSSQLKPVYVRKFLGAMIELGLLED